MLKETKIVDTKEYITVLKGLVEEGHEVSCIVSGSSMSPFLCHGRDTVSFKAPDRELKAGDIVFYQRFNGRYVLHRICRVHSDCFDIVGDGQTQVESPVYPSQIFGLVTKVQRKGKWLQPGDFWWDFFEKVWIRIIPLRPVLTRLYGKISRHI